MRRRDGNPQAGGEKQRDRAPGFRGEAPHRLELGDLLSHRPDDSPAPEESAEGHREVAGDDDPEGQAVGRGRAAGDQHQPDDAHRFLRIVAAVTDAVEGRRQQLQSPEPLIHGAR